MGDTKWFDRVTLGLSAVLLGAIAVIVILMLSSCSTPSAPQSPLATPTPAAKIAVGAVTDELVTIQSTKTYTWPLNIQWSSGSVGPLALSSEGPITTTLWIDTRLKRGGTTVYSSSIRGPLSAPDAPGEGQFDRIVIPYSAPSGQYQLYTRIRWEFASTSTVFNDSITPSQVITSPFFGYFQNDDGTIAPRDSEGFSKVADITNPYVYYFPLVTKNAR